MNGWLKMKNIKNKSSFKDILASMDISIDHEWHEKAVLYLRGGDGGEHGPILYNLVKTKKQKKVLDIGTARGFSALYMAKAFVDPGIEDGIVYTIDIISNDEVRHWHVPKQSSQDPARGKLMSRAELLSKFEKRILDHVVFLTGDSKDVLSNWRLGPIDLAFIDGDHSYKGVKRDFLNVKQNLTRDGCIVFDDYDIGRTKCSFHNYLISRAKLSGVKRVVDEAIRSGEWIAEIVPIGCIFLWRKVPDYGIAILHRVREVS